MDKNQKLHENRRKNQPKTRKYVAQRRKPPAGAEKLMRARYQAKMADRLKKQRRNSLSEEQQPENERAQAADAVTDEAATAAVVAGQQAVALTKHDVQRVRELRCVIRDAPASQGREDTSVEHINLPQTISPEIRYIALQAERQPVRLEKTGRAVVLQQKQSQPTTQERGKQLFRRKRIEAIRVKLRRRDAGSAPAVETHEYPAENKEPPLYPIAERKPVRDTAARPEPLPYPIEVCRKEFLSQERRRKESIGRSAQLQADTVHTGRSAKAVNRHAQKIQLAQQENRTVARKGCSSVADIAGRIFRTVSSSAQCTGGGLFGGIVLLSLILLTGMVGALVSSPFGVLFSPQETSPEARSISAAIAETDNEYFDYINEIISNMAHDKLVVQRIPKDGTTDTRIHTWEEILAVFAVKTTTDPDNAAGVVMIDEDRTARLKAVFWDMVTVSHHIETTGSGEDEKRTLYLTISVQTPEQAAAGYHFSKVQTGALKEMLLPENKALLTELIGWATGVSGGGYHVSTEALSDERFAAMLAEAEKYLGFPYVWGGSTPQTSFDCSGFVCWVLNQSGVMQIERTTATGIYNRCTVIPKENARPGDLVFFTGTYNSPGPISHIGIYVGDGMMIHAGDPIKYSSIETAYWQEHFYAMARIPL